MEDIPALARAGKIDKEVKLGYCAEKQPERIFNLYSFYTEGYICSAHVCDLILSDTSRDENDFEVKLDLSSNSKLDPESVIKMVVETAVFAKHEKVENWKDSQRKKAIKKWKQK